MATITDMQVDKYNKECKNGFKFDVSYYMMRGEKTLFKDINIKPDEILRAKLFYQQSRGDKTPCLYINTGIKCRDFYSFSGLGQFINVGEATKTKNLKKLQELTIKFTDEYILSLHDEKITSKSTLF